MHHVQLNHISIVSKPPIVIVKAHHSIRVLSQPQDVLARDNVRADGLILFPISVVLRAGLFACNRHLWFSKKRSVECSLVGGDFNSVENWCYEPLC